MSMSLSGSGKFWSSKLNDDGFMGLVDKWWLFWKRVNTIIAFICFILTVVVVIVVLCVGNKEGFNTSRLRHQNKRYT